MVLKYMIMLVLVVNTSTRGSSDEEYVDSVIDMLLNGGSKEFSRSDEDDGGEEPVLSGGIWKCGSCNDIDESKLLYSEVNDVDSDVENEESVDVQVGFTLQDMRCITVSADSARVVRRVSGSCTGGTVTLNVAPAHHFTVQVYN